MTAKWIIEERRKRRARNLAAQIARSERTRVPGVWYQDDRRAKHRGFVALGHNGLTYSIGVQHGDSWVAMEYGPRGALHMYKDFYGPMSATNQCAAREWCEGRWHG